MATPNERTLSEIFNMIVDYVESNPHNIEFSTEFMKAYYEVKEIDNQLQDEEFEAFLKQNLFTDASTNDRIHVFRRNFFLLQLEIIVRKKTILEEYCPKSPNVKILINLFNDKIEALLDVLSAQKEMDKQRKFADLKDTDYNTILETIRTIQQSARRSYYMLQDYRGRVQNIQNGEQNNETVHNILALQRATANFENVVTSCNNTIQKIKQTPIPNVLPYVEDQTITGLINSMNNETDEQQRDSLNLIIRTFTTSTDKKAKNVIEQKLNNDFTQLLNQLPDEPYNADTIPAFFEIPFPFKRHETEMDAVLQTDDIYIHTIQSTLPSINRPLLFTDMLREHGVSYQNTYMKKKQKLEEGLKAVEQQHQFLTKQIEEKQNMLTILEQNKDTNEVKENIDSLKYNIILLNDDMDILSKKQDQLRNDVQELETNKTNVFSVYNALIQQYHINIPVLDGETIPGPHPEPPVDPAIPGPPPANEQVGPVPMQGPPPGQPPYPIPPPPDQPPGPRQMQFGQYTNVEKIYNFFEQDRIKKIHILAMIPLFFKTTNLIDVMLSFYVPINNGLFSTEDTETVYSFLDPGTTQQYIHMLRLCRLVQNGSSADVPLLTTSFDSCVELWEKKQALVETDTVLKNVLKNVLHELNPVHVFVHDCCDTEKRNPCYRFDSKTGSVCDDIQFEFYNTFLDRFGCYDVLLRNNRLVFRDNIGPILNTNTERTYYSRLKAVRYDLKKPSVDIERRVFENAYMSMITENDPCVCWTNDVYKALLDGKTIIWVQMGLALLAHKTSKFQELLTEMIISYNRCRVEYIYNNEKQDTVLFEYNDTWINSTGVSLYKHVCSFFYDTIKQPFCISVLNFYSTENDKKGMLVLWDNTILKEHTSLIKNIFIRECLKKKKEQYKNIDRLVSVYPSLLYDMGLFYDYCPSTDIPGMSFGQVLFPFDIQDTTLVFSIHIDTTDCSNEELLPNSPDIHFFENLFNTENTENTEKYHDTFVTSALTLKNTNITNMFMNPYSLPYIDISKLKIMYNICSHLHAIQKSIHYTNLFKQLMKQVQEELITPFRSSSIQ